MLKHGTMPHFRPFRPSPPDLARWKQADYRRLARHRAAAAADRAFDAEVGIEPPDEEFIQAGPFPEYQPAPSRAPFENEAQTQAQGLYYLTKIISWFKMLGEVPWVKRLVGVGEYSVMRAANPLPMGDAALGALEQLMDDERRPKKLTWWQRVGRVGVKAVESFLTGFASDGFLAIGGSTGAAAGGTVEPAGGEFLGLPVGIIMYIGSSLWLDEIFWPSFNEKHLDFLGEWQNDAP